MSSSELEKFAQRYEVDATVLRRWIIEAMVLGAVADGEFDRRESDEILTIVASHAEFTGMTKEDLRSDLERAFGALMSDGFHVRLQALAAALPRYAHRVLAFRSAVAVAFADGRLADDELGFLRRLQEALGIAEADVMRAFESAQEDDPAYLPEAVEPVEAYLDVLLMAAAADRILQEEELATLVAFIITRSEFDGVAEEHVREYMNDGLRSYASGGIDDRLVTLPAELPEMEQRENAYGLAASMVVVDGEIAPEEKAFMAKLQDVLELDEDRVGLVLRSIEEVRDA